MMTKVASWTFVALVIGSVFSLGGCLQTRNQVQQQEEKKVFQDQVKNLQENRADSQSRLQELQTETLRYNGRIETLEARMTSLDRNMLGQSKINDQRIGEYSVRLKTLEEASLNLNQKMDAMITEMQDLRSQIAAQEKMTEKKTSKSSSGDSAPTKTSSKGPYTTGEEHYNKKAWGEAVISYMDYRDQNPNGKYYSEATYKIGYAFQQLGKANQAKSFYEEVSNRFPNSPFSKKAQAQLKSIK
ncbi:MAG: tetratricopeptide repeat protein [Pseudomonadota bacterium]|nr:tetratricopeptide repeat protein [Pseudomonadota bacterium]